MGSLHVPGGGNIQLPKPDTVALLKSQAVIQRLLATQNLMLDALLRITALKQAPEEVVKILNLRIPGYNFWPEEEDGRSGDEAEQPSPNGEGTGEEGADANGSGESP